MSGLSQPAAYFIGWDVGGWNCDTNRDSRDAIVILDSTLAIAGKPWRGNLRKFINEASSTGEWIRQLFALCTADHPGDAVRAILAIDTPLGFSEAFVGLVTGLKCVGPVEEFRANPYLFRETERHLFRHGLTPLSAITHQIGSPATKGMHVLAKFAPQLTQCGVWTDGACLTAIEAYPSACKTSDTMHELWRRYPELDHPDKRDALTCALIAYLFASRPDTLSIPDRAVPISEGWIWVPKDVLRPEQHERGTRK
jgi:hypothetical protein